MTDLSLGARLAPYKLRHKVRFVTAAALFDGHDASINIMRRILQASGVEVIHLGHNRSVEQIVAAALQEDAQGIAVSSYQGGHVEFFKYMVDCLKARGGAQIKVFGGGGGVIVPDEIRELTEYGVTHIYSVEDGQKLGLQGMINDMVERCDVDPGKSAPREAGAILEALAGGDRRALARIITALENGHCPADARSEIVSRAAAVAVPVLGITGTGGAGKSSLTDELIRRFRLDLDDRLRIAVIAVDPSRRKSGGALLGDRIRMGSHAGHENCFIRSLSARGQLGGLSASTGAVVDLLDAAGFDTVIVETVGAGQSEVDLARLADTRVVLCPPGLGDEVQALKAGILELADLLVVSKADHPLAGRTAAELRDMLALRRHGGAHPGARTWQPRVLEVDAAAGTGLEALLEAIEEHRRAIGCGRRLQAREAEADTADTAALCARLAARDPFVTSLGGEFAGARPGAAEVALAIRAQHLNFNGTCHGGVIFALADTAFGLASNSRGRLAAGIDAHVTYHSAVHEGERLLARAREISRSRKLAVYRVDVERADGTLVAAFTGTVFITGAHPAGEGTSSRSAGGA